MSKPSLSAAVPIALDGEDYEMIPTLKAATAVSDKFGGLQNVFMALAAGRIDAFQAVIRAGIPRKEISDDDLGEAIFRTGLKPLGPPLIKFVNRLANGGRDPEDAEADADDEDEAEAGNGEV